MKKFVFLLIVYSISPAAQATHWALELGSGMPYNFVTPLTVSQDFEPDINLSAHYISSPQKMPFYYYIRIGKWCGCWAWEFEDIHHKIYLSNTNDTIKHFSISHGYNLLYLNRSVLWHGLVWRLGGGLVVGHPESTVRGLVFSEAGGTFNNGGYYLSGASFQASLAKKFYFNNRFFVDIEGKLTASQANVRVVNGEAYAPNIALHANFGLGYDFSKY